MFDWIVMMAFFVAKVVIDGTLYVPVSKTLEHRIRAKQDEIHRECEKISSRIKDLKIEILELQLSEDELQLEQNSAVITPAPEQDDA